MGNKGNQDKRTSQNKLEIALWKMNEEGQMATHSQKKINKMIHYQKKKVDESQAIEDNVV
jgi:hypothetical protein